MPFKYNALKCNALYLSEVSFSHVCVDRLLNMISRSMHTKVVYAFARIAKILNSFVGPVFVVYVSLWFQYFVVFDIFQ